MRPQSSRVCSSSSRSAPPLLYYRKRALAIRSRPGRDGQAADDAAVAARAPLSRSRNARRRRWESRWERWAKSQIYAALFSHANRRATILASVPWFLQVLGMYRIGIFTPTTLTSVGQKTKHVRSVAYLINNDILTAMGAALIDVLLIVGMFAQVCSPIGSVGSGWRSSASLAVPRACCLPRFPASAGWHAYPVDLSRLHAV